jgi:hypothetical protein
MSAASRRRRALCSAVSISTAAAILALVLTFAGAGSAASKAVPTNNTLPSISGKTEDGKQLTATDGTWTNSPGSFHYTWQRCDTSGGSCSAVGSDSNQYTLVSADVGSTMRVKVVAHNADGDSLPAKSDKTDVVTAGGTKPSNTSLPTISGTAQDNQTLTADHGNWSGTTPISYAYMWLRCDSSGANCVDNGGASQTYHVSSSDVGHKLRVNVTATNSKGSDTAKSDPTAVVTSAGGANQAPVNTSLPSISGTAQDGQTFTASEGSWNPSSGNNFTYQWQRCDSSGNSCSNISGATSASYRNTSSDVGHRLRVAVKATNSLGNSTATSSASSVVAAAGTTTTTPTTTTPPPAGKVISINDVVPPNRLIVSSTRFTPSSIGSTGQRLTARIRIIDEKSGTSVSGAIVYAIGVPANRVTVPPETTTDASGWATVTFETLRGLPIKQGAVLTFFIRARKAGEDLLGGVSNRRLISVRVRPS